MAFETKKPRSALTRLRAALLGMVAAGAIVTAGGSLVGGGAVDALAQNLAQGAAQSDYSRSYADLVERVLPAVVNVSVEKTERMANVPTPFDNPEMQRFFERFFGQPMPNQPMPNQPPREFRERGEGSGFVIDGQGHIVTNAHVVNGATKITVTLQDNETVPAALVGIDEKTDLAVIKIETSKKLAFVPWGDSSKVRVGDKVLAVGNPFGLGGTVTSGIISATGRELGAGPYDDFLQVDAAINRGNSGGPTFNLDGQVVGVNSIIFSPSGGNVGIGFAISSNLAQEITTDLIESGSVTRGWLGVGIQQVTPDLAQSLGLGEAEGAIVTNVEPNGPAAKGGIQTGDVILSFGGTNIERVRELTRAVADVQPGQSAEVKVIRNGQERTLQVAVGRMPSQQQAAATSQPDAPSQARLGVALAQLTPEMKRQLDLPAEARGVLIQAVQPGSPAEEKGLQAGDIILRVGQQEVSTPEEVTRLVRKAQDQGEKSILILFQREGAQLFAAVPFAVS